MAHAVVSVIIPAFNEAQVIIRNLQAISSQTYTPIETIVVDDGSSDDTVKIAREFTSKVFLRAHAERSVQRNFGASQARGDFLLFLDADMEMTPKVVATCVTKMSEDNRIGSIAIPEKPIATNFWEKVKGFERSFYSERGDPDTDAARFFRRSAFLQAKGYDETLTGPEDWDLPERIKKLGFKTSRVTELINHYERVPSLRNLMQKKYYYALTAHRYLENHNLPLFGPKTIYFLRPVFYRQWRKLLTHPLLTVGMTAVFLGELGAGGAGFIVGKVKSL